MVSITSVNTVCVSGGFDPLHEGHLALFREAATHGPLTVIINSDAWLLRKKGFVFLPWEQRASLIADLRYVASVAHVDDTDNTVCEALSRLKPRYFANGGDRKPGNTPEIQLCEKQGIGLLWNIGGGKADSSSDIARKAWVTRPWGGFVTLDEARGYKVKKLIIEPGQSISEQSHNHRCEYWYITGPGGQVQLDSSIRQIAPHSHPVSVEKNTIHRLTNTSLEPLTVIEIQSGDYLEEDDIIRVAESLATA